MSVSGISKLMESRLRSGECFYYNEFTCVGFPNLQPSCSYTYNEWKQVVREKVRREELKSVFNPTLNLDDIIPLSDRPPKEKHKPIKIEFKYWKETLAILFIVVLGIIMMVLRFGVM